jgi:hypothetical protein
MNHFSYTVTFQASKVIFGKGASGGIGGAISGPVGAGSVSGFGSGAEAE